MSIIFRIFAVPKQDIMKKVCLLVVGLMLAASGFSQNRSQIPPIQWYSFEDALTLNAERAAYGLPPRKIFVDVYTDWCGWCKRMDATTFAHPVIADKLNTLWIPVKINAERKDTVIINGQTFVNENPASPHSPHQLAVALLNGNLGYPSFALIDETGRPIQILQGFQQAPQLEVILEFFGSNAYRDTGWEDFQQTFQGVVRE